MKLLTGVFFALVGLAKISGNIVYSFLRFLLGVLNRKNEVFNSDVETAVNENRAAKTSEAKRRAAASLHRIIGRL